ncbi:hypothetical protein [Nocardioides eburneiflavus]|uniref:hypothetical protein n=1 Tax=Nocardioides eburneiflavus TaxID=2518372 RepID=UPI00143D8B04|nr:hypothetical protein [Nocardioides eburneiflavus]
MTPVRRIAAAALVAALGLGFAGIGAAPANAVDTTWGYKVKGGSTQSLDTTWGYKKNFR